jgi:hypothetical protein
MQLNSNILKELEELSPTLVGLPRNNVFNVPDGYFESLSGELLLKTSQSATTYSVPEGYFDQLAGQILSTLKTAELESDVAAEMLTLSPTVAGIGNNNVFSVPNHYFVQSAHQTEVHAETVAISASVADIGKSIPYTVPTGYFEQLADSILAKKDTTATIVSMKRRPFAWRYAAAAITAVMAVSIWFIMDDNDQPTGGTMTAAVQQDAKKILVNNSFEQEMSTISDAAIVEFLQNKGQNVEAALVASYTDVEDESELPDATDYMLNENTLDELLQTLQLND